MLFRMGRRADTWRIARLAISLLVVVGVALLGGSSHAAVVLKFVPSSTSPGATVEVISVAQSLEGESYEVFLAPSQRVADRVSSPRNDPRLVRIGRFPAKGSSPDRFTFRVPRLRPGNYVAVLCTDCDARSSTFSALGGFRVTAGSRLPQTGGKVGLFVAVGLLLLGLGQLLLRRKAASGDAVSPGRLTFVGQGQKRRVSLRIRSGLGVSRRRRRYVRS